MDGLYGSRMRKYQQDDDYNRKDMNVKQSKHKQEKNKIFNFEVMDIPKLNKNQQEYKIKMAESREMCTMMIAFNITENKTQIIRFIKDNNIQPFIDLDLMECKELGGGLLVGFDKMLKTIVKPQKLEEKIAQIDNIFMDSKGYHTIMTTNINENYYVNSQMRQVKQLQKLTLPVTAVAFDFQGQSTPDSTGQILLGTRDGRIILYKIDLKKKEDPQETILNKLMTLKHDDCHIRHLLSFTLGSSEKSNKGNQRIVLAVTQSNIITFKGPMGNYEALFTPYEQNQTKIIERPLPRSVHQKGILFHLYYSRVPSDNHIHPTSLICTNGSILNYIKLSLYQDTFEINETKSLTYYRRNNTDEASCQVTDMPLGLIVTDLHYYILHPDCLIVVSQITEKVVMYQELNQAISMHFNHLDKKLIITTEKKLYHLNIRNEDQDAWKLYVDKGMLQDAYMICKQYHSPMLKHVAGIYAHQLLSIPDKHQETAEMFFNSNISFEQAVLNFLQENKQQGLQEYLQLWLDHFKDRNDTKDDTLVQEMILLSYLTELKLFQLNQLESEILYFQSDNNKCQKQKIHEFKSLKGKFIKFLKDNKDNLHKETTQQLLVSHGRVDECLEYFKEKNDYEAIIKHYINEEDYVKAIEYLHKLPDANPLLRKYVNILMKKEANLMTNYLKKYLKEDTPINFLIPYILDIPENQSDLALSFVKHLIQTQKHSLSKSDKQEDLKALYNIYIYLLAQQKFYSQDLEDFLDQQEKLQEKEEQQNAFDLDFALRMFRKNSIVKGQIKIYGLMGLNNEAVALALKEEDTETAEKYASKPQSEEAQRRLWLQIANHLFHRQKQNITEIIELTNKNKNLKIQDILPHFNGNINITDFKDQLCNSLKEYDNDIETLQTDMEGFSKNVQQQLDELRAMNGKYFIIESEKTCDECKMTIFGDSTHCYVFPCSHAFHKKCIINRLQLLPEDMGKETLDKINELNEKMHAIHSNYKGIDKDTQKLQGFIHNFFSFRSNHEKNNEFSTEDNSELTKLQDQMNDQLASECLNCGSIMVDLINIPFGNDRSRDSWKI